MGKNISRLTINNRLVPLTIGVTILSLLVVFAISAWTGPPAAPPDPNAPAPINVSSDAQTKEGDLSVANLYLNAVANQGNLQSVGYVVGYDDLHLWSNSLENAAVYISGSNLSFWSGGSQRLNIDNTGALTQGIVPWARLNAFPGDCPSGEYMVGINVDGSLKCSAP